MSKNLCICKYSWQNSGGSRILKGGGGGGGIKIGQKTKGGRWSKIVLLQTDLLGGEGGV